ERPELGDQRLGQRLDVAPRDGAKQHKLKEFVVGDRIGPGVEEALAQPLAMTEIVWRGLGQTGLVVIVTDSTGHRRSKRQPERTTSGCGYWGIDAIGKCADDACKLSRAQFLGLLARAARGPLPNRPVGSVQARYGGLCRPLGEVVKISTPEPVTPMVCSNCADSE